MENLIEELKKEIIEVLNLEEMDIKDIDPNEPLFGEKFGLSSIDALELIVLLERKYNIKIESAEDGKKIFYSIQTMAEYIMQHKN